MRSIARLFPSLLLFSILVAVVVVQADSGHSFDSANSWSKRLQARKADIVDRLKTPRALRPRASPTPCDTVNDNDGNCCDLDALDDQGDCCTADAFYSPTCSSSACCNGGHTYSPGFLGVPTQCCVSPGVVFVANDQGTEACCPTGVVIGMQCCLDNQHIEGEHCVDNTSATLRKRYAQSTSIIVRRSPQHTRLLLSADLVAEHLVNNGIFVHEGKEYTDIHHRAHNDGVLRRLAGKGVTQALRYVFRPGAVYNADRWNAVDYVPISEAYEFAVADVPEIYARIVARPDFETFHWQGASFDRDIIYRMASGHPGYNESLIDLYR